MLLPARCTVVATKWTKRKIWPPFLLSRGRLLVNVKVISWRTERIKMILLNTLQQTQQKILPDKIISSAGING